MATFFKCSCCPLWLSFLVVLSFYIAIGYLSTFSVNFYEIQVLDQLTIINFSILLVWCLFACGLVKCNIINKLVSACFLFPIIFVIPSMSIAGMVYAGTASEVVDKSLSDDLHILKLAQWEFNKTKELPDWLTMNEQEHRCCGIRKYSDYKEGGILYDMKIKLKIKHYDLPIQCCAVKNDTSCNKGIFNQSLDNLKEKDSKFYINGCNREIKQKSLDHIDMNYKYYIVKIIICVVMALIFLINYFKVKSPEFEESVSEHSLDQEIYIATPPKYLRFKAAQNDENALKAAYAMYRKYSQIPEDDLLDENSLSMMSELGVIRENEEEEIEQVSQEPKKTSEDGKVAFVVKNETNESST